MNIALMTMIFFFIAGCIFLGIEACIPGFGFFGGTGLSGVIIALIIAFYVPYGLYIFFLMVIASSVSIYFIVKYIKKRQLYGKIVLDETVGFEKKDYKGLEKLVGKEGVSKTVLKPFGSAEFNGVTIDVYTEGEYINSNVRVTVTKFCDNKLYVKEIN